MRRRDFMKNGAALSATLGVASSFSACGNSQAKIYSKKIKLIYKHNLKQTAQSYYNSLTKEEQKYLDKNFPNLTHSTQTLHKSNDELFLVNHTGTSRLQLDKKVVTKSTTSSTLNYTYEVTMPKNNYAMHMFYKKIDLNSNPYIKDSEDDIDETKPPKYSLLMLALIVPNSSDKDETITFDNAPREIVKSLIFSAPAFKHFSSDDLSYALSKFDDIFTGKDFAEDTIKITTNLERSIAYLENNHQRWYYYQAYREQDGSATLRTTQRKDVNGNIIHDIGDPIYTFPLKELLVPQLKEDLTKVIQYLSADKQIAPQLLPTQKSPTNIKARANNITQSILKRATTYNGISYKIDTNSLKSEGLDIVLDKVDSKGLHITASNSYNRHSGLSVVHLDENEKNIGSITQLNILSPRYALMSVPLTDYRTSMTVTVPPKATTSRFILSSLSFNNGHHRKLYDTQNKDAISNLLTDPEAYTIAFEMALPALLIAFGANLKRDGSFNKLLITLGIKFALNIATPFIAHPNLRGSKALLPILTGMGTTLLKAKNSLAALLTIKFTEAEAEDSVPIAGQILRAINIAVDVSNLGQTIYALGTTNAINIVDITRTHTLKLQLKSDPKDNDFPLNISSFVVTLKHKSSTIAKSPYIFTWDRNNVKSHTVNGGGTYSTYDINIDDVPAGGTINISVQLKIGDWIAAHKEVLKADNITQNSIEVLMKENLIPLGGSSIYQHYAKLTKSGSTYTWNVKPQNGSFLASASVSDSDRAKNELLKISVNDPIGAIGYSYKDINTNQYIVKNISAVLTTPNQGTKSYSSANMIQLSYNLTASNSTDGHLIFEQKGGYTYVRNVDINSQSTDFNIDYSKNIGIFITDKVSQFAYYPEQNIVVALDTDLGVLHILYHSNTSINDTNSNRYLNSQSMVKTRSIVSDVEVDPTTQYMYNPQLLTMSPTGDIVILENTRSGSTRLRAFDKYGAVDLNFSGFNNNSGVFALKKENTSVFYLDINIESKGFIYVLKQLGSDPTNSDTYFLDIYDPASSNPTTPIVTTKGFSTAKIKVDYWRRVYALNYETTEDNEPTISVWIPPVP